MLICLMACLPAHGAQIVLQPSADTSIFEAFPTNNLGATDNLPAGANANLARGRPLFRFTFAPTIPSNAIIQSVSLALTVVGVPPDGGQGSTFDLHRLLVDWGEGAGTNNTGAPVNPGEADWNARFYPSNLWTSPGGSISNDFSEIVSVSTFLGNVGTYTFPSTPNLVSDVQNWLRTPAINFGWILLSESENVAFTVRRLGTRESTNPPLLTVSFALPVPPAVQIAMSPTGQIQLSFLASAGQSYSVQFRDSLNLGDWLTLTNLGPISTTTNITASDPFPSNSFRFYRISSLNPVAP